MAHPGSPPNSLLPVASSGRKKTIILVSTVVAGAMLIAAAALLYPWGGAAPQAAPREVGIGIASEDGGLQFSVVKLQWSRQAGNTKQGVAVAEGRFLLVHVMVLNTGEEPETYRASAQKLFAGGREYPVAAKAAALLYDSNEKVIDPGDSLVVMVPFDLARNVTPDTIELHTDPDSTGVRVALR